MSKILSSKGRLNRGKYFGYGLILGLINIAAQLIIVYTNFTLIGIGIGLGIYFLAILAGIGLVIRRLHDLNLSGWLYFLIFIPIISSFLYFSLLIIPGTKGPNKYGSNPLS